eukprot:3864623-Pyramimonas_sp.AAC.1
MIGARLERGRELRSPKRVGAGCSQYNRWCAVGVPSRLVLDLDVLDDRVVALVHRHPSHNAAPLGAILRRLNVSSSSLTNTSMDTQMYSAGVISLCVM